jgi:hypothetical protein
LQIERSIQWDNVCMTILLNRATRVAALAAVAFAVTRTPLSAQTTGVETYLVSSATAQPGGPVVTTELLQVTAAGELNVPASDPAAACYTTALGILSDATRPKNAAPAAIDLSFYGNPIAVPLRLTDADLHNGLEGITVNGSVEGTFDKLPQTGIAIAVQGNVIARDHLLVGARFMETSFVTATQAALGQSMCTIAHLIPATPGAAPSAPETITPT